MMITELEMIYSIVGYLIIILLIYLMFKLGLGQHTIFGDL